jgi:hypothetical protein
MRVEDFKKIVEERKTYVEDKLNNLNQKHEYKHNLMFGNGAVGYEKVMAENRGKGFYEDTKEGQQLNKLVIAIQQRKNELRAIEAYLKVINIPYKL